MATLAICTPRDEAGAQTVVTALRGLGFGTIISGTTSSVATTATGAMEIDIFGKLGANGGFSFTLPTSLTRVGGGGSMPITFCSTCGSYRLNVNNPSGAIAFNPATGVTGLIITIDTHVYVWLGGSVSPPLNQAPGSYTGTVILTLAPII